MGSATTRGTRSRKGGVPTVLPDPAALRDGQMALVLDPPGGPPGDAEPVVREFLPRVVHIGSWLGRDAQRALVEYFRAWAVPPAGLRHRRGAGEAHAGGPGRAGPPRGPGHVRPGRR